MIFRPFFVIALAAFGLAGCVTARMHSQEELAAVGRRCGVPLGNLAQFDEEPRLLFLMPVEGPRPLACVSRWARRNGLRLVNIDQVAEE